MSAKSEIIKGYDIYANYSLKSDEAPPTSWKYCVIQGVYGGKNNYNGKLGGRISAVFVILVTSAFATLFPVIARRIPKLRIPEVVYMISRMFGSGVIVATAFIHLMQPAFKDIGSNSCIGKTWSSHPHAKYDWCPAIVLAGSVITFIIDAYCDFLADIWYGVHDHMHRAPGVPPAETSRVSAAHDDTEFQSTESISSIAKRDNHKADDTTEDGQKLDYYSQFAGFLVLEFGILFHSVMIGLTLGVSDEYGTLYPVLVFHQAFEGLGIGTRLAVIPFPKNRKWVPYFCCIAYALTTPVCVAIGLGVRNSYRNSSYNAKLISGVLDAISAGILVYTGFVELLARDFMFNPYRTKSVAYLSLQLFVFLWGVGIMALLGKWA